jgi:hypothetical protein
MKPALVIGAVSALLLGGCGGQARDPESRGPDAALRLTHVLDPTATAHYVEGSIWHVRVLDSNGRAVVDRQVQGERTALNLAPGSYRFVSEELPCDGNCGHLDPPMDRCSEEFSAEPGKKLAAKVTLRPSQGCSIDFGT